MTLSDHINVNAVSKEYCCTALPLFCTALQASSILLIFLNLMNGCGRKVS